MTDDAKPAARRCSATNRRGEPCGCPPLKGHETCSAHSPAIPDESRFGSAERARVAGQLGGRPRVERATDVARRLVAENVAVVLGPLFEALGHHVRVVDGEPVLVPRRAGRARMTAQQIAVVGVAEKLLDRVDGRARQQVELSGPAGGPIDLKTDSGWDMNKLSPDELAQLQDMAVRARPERPA